MFNSKRKWFFFPLVPLAAIAGFGFVVMLIWNAVIPDVFQGPTVTYWQAILLLILARILFGGGPFRHPAYANHSFRDKFKKMSPEEQEAFRAKWNHIRQSRWHSACGTTEQKANTEEESK